MEVPGRKRGLSKDFCRTLADVLDITLNLLAEDGTKFLLIVFGIWFGEDVLFVTGVVVVFP